MEAVNKLVEQKFAPAMHLLAEMLIAGELVPADTKRARELIARAADQNYGPSLYAEARQRLENAVSPGELGKLRGMVERAANLGSVQAQYFLGGAYAEGNPRFGYQTDPERSERYFRLCATRGLAQCQARLGRLLTESHPDEAAAWLELAAAKGETSGAAALRELREKLSPEQERRARSLQEQIRTLVLAGV
jgi:TPR repeat protein